MSERAIAICVIVIAKRPLPMFRLPAASSDPTCDPVSYPVPIVAQEQCGVAVMAHMVAVVDSMLDGAVGNFSIQPGEGILL